MKVLLKRGKIVGWLIVLCLLYHFSIGNTKAESNKRGNEGYQVQISTDNVSLMAGDTITLTAKVTYNGQEISNLEESGLHLWWWADVWTSGTEDGNTDITFHNYSNGDSHSLSVDATLNSVGNYYIAVTLEDSSYQPLFKDTLLTVTTTTYIPPVNAPIFVEKVPSLDNDFIMGVDISSVISQFSSGVTYKDFNGNTINNIVDFCKFLKEDCGITHVRVRVWNNPYNSSGNGYGGGNNDVNTAVKIAKGCAEAGIKMLIDFHYSDFWADPAKQQAPKEWKDYTIQQKAEAMNEFTKDALYKIMQTGVTVDMVQIGNETTNGFVGVWEKGGMCQLFQAGAKAVREVNSNIKVVIHLTNPEKAMMTTWAKVLSNYGVDYDILATSYYPYWHGTLENLKSEFETVRKTYGKEVMVAETSYANSLVDTDGHPNTVSVGANDTVTSYPFTVQGQANFLRDLIDTVNKAGGLGVYYWEPAWITVGNTTNLSGDAFTKQWEYNSQLWEAYGSGWASKYSGEYEAEDAGKWYGGSAVDNQALFYADGTPAPSIKVWDYVKTGATTNEVSVEKIGTSYKEVTYNESVTMSEYFPITYNQGEVWEKVSWNQQDLQAVNTRIAGEYTIRGVVTFSKSITQGEYAKKTQADVIGTVVVLPYNLIVDENDAGFEVGTNFTVNGNGIKYIPSTEDVLEGEGTLHWYSSTAQNPTITYNKEIYLEAGRYTFDAIAMGAYNDAVSLQILNANNQVIVTGEETKLNGWTLNVWECENPKVTFQLTSNTVIKLQIKVGIQAEGWGSLDRLRLYQCK